jgi:hypothetical protein
MQRRTAMLAIAALTSALVTCLWPTDGADPQGPAVLVSPQAPVDTTLALSADTYLRQGEPNQNFGTESILRIRPTGKNRALLQVDPAALAAAVGGAAVSSARLELTITYNGNNWGPAGRTIALHRLTVPWTELGATWNCGVDTVPGNPQAECAPGTAWEMGTAGPNPWEATPTATTTITNGLTGVVTLDVTADVTNWLGGTPNHGWILKRVDEGPSGAVEFGARESTNPPVLVITTQSAISWPILENTLPELDTSRVVRLASGRLMYRTDITLRFRDDVSDSAKTAFFSRHAMSVIGVTRSGQFFVRIPDPGPSPDSLFSILQQLRTEPEIHSAASLDRSPMEEVRDARYPTDGPGQARSDWLDTVFSTWALRAIRAPLAWGCETGTYGGTLPRVGIFEWKHQRTHPEFASSGPAFWEPPDAQLAHIHAASAAEADANARHAAATTGLLAAEGDNGSGVAGMTWKTGLYLYAGYSSPGNHPLPIVDNFFALAERIVADRVRILSLSADVVVDSTKPPSEREGLIRALADNIQKDLMDPLPSLLIVVAAGNQRYRGDVLTYLRDPGAAVIRAALLLLRNDPGYRQRIIVATGTTPGNRFWDTWPSNPTTGANFFTGFTDVAAPAQDVTVLDRWTGQTGSAVPLTVATGTSLAAPQVAGAAALLLTMDSSLTGAQLKDYITRGARFRINASGRLDTATAVSGAPETVYQLDAYGALTLLSRERPTTTPICGGQVWARDTAIYVDQGGGTPLRALRIPGATFLALPSLAQGGRFVAVTNFSTFGAFQAWNVSTMAPHAKTDLPGVYARQYLERDTADLKAVHDFGFGLSLTVHRTGTDLTDLRLESLVVPPGATGIADIIRVSPLGDLAAVHSHVDLPTAESIDRWDLVRLTSSPQLVGGPIAFLLSPQDPPCTTDCPASSGDVTWSHDSRRALFTLWRWNQLGDEITSIATRMVSAVQVPGSMALDSGNVSGAWLLRPRFTPDDSLLVAEHPGLLSGNIGPPCQERRREPTFPFAERVGAARDALLADFCDPFSDGPGIFNAPPPGVAAGVWGGPQPSMPGHLKTPGPRAGVPPRGHH